MSIQHILSLMSTRETQDSKKQFSNVRGDEVSPREGKTKPHRN